MSKNDLMGSLPNQTIVELLTGHGVDPNIFSSNSITLGADKGWQEALCRQARKKVREAGEKAAPSHEIAAEQRRINHNSSRKYKNTPAENWNIYSVQVCPRGKITPGAAFVGQRLHPKYRSEDKYQIKFDTSGSDVKVFLPILSWEGAMDLLGHYGFSSDPKAYQPEHAWEFVYSQPQIPVWLEESALKAMASCSIGQLAVGINGINSGGQKLRSDRLRGALKCLAKHERSIVVRFDCGEASVRQAKKLCRLFEKEGANASWYCWIGGVGLPEKTDDYIAAKLHGINYPADNPLLVRQEDIRVKGKLALPPYSRLMESWNTLLIEREFSGTDIVNATKESRVVALVGATGTGKTKACVEAIQLLEEERLTRMTVLGIYHRASLVHKGAYEFGVRDMSAPRGSIERERGLYENVFCRDGLFCCCESIKKVKGGESDLWRWSLDLQDKPRATVLFLDEISQTMLHLLLGGTDGLRKTRSEAVLTLERLLANPCVTVIAAESGLGDIELAWLKEITGATPSLIRSSFVRDRVLFIGPSNKENINALQQIASDNLASGSKVWISMGQASTVSSFSKPFISSYNCLTITAENSASDEVCQFMGDTETFGSNYSLVAFSPAVTSGISLTSHVGLAACVQQYAMSPEDALQALDRARNSSNRVLLFPRSVPNALLGSGETTDFGVIQTKVKKASRGQENFYLDLWKRINPATRQYAIALESRNNLEAYQNHHVLMCRLKEQGYRLKSFDQLLEIMPTKTLTCEEKA